MEGFLLFSDVKLEDVLVEEGLLSILGISDLLNAPYVLCCRVARVSDTLDDVDLESGLTASSDIIEVEAKFSGFLECFLLALGPLVRFPVLGLHGDSEEIEENVSKLVKESLLLFF